MAAEKIHWHPALAASMELQFLKYHVEIETEHQLTTEPLKMDMLIIKKHSDEVIDNENGNLFRRYTSSS